MIRQLYVVTPTDIRVPPVRIAAFDPIDIGSQVALHMTRHRRLTRGVPYDAQIGDDHGAITQSGLRQPLTFTIAKDSR